VHIRNSQIGAVRDLNSCTPFDEEGANEEKVGAPGGSFFRFGGFWGTGELGLGRRLGGWTDWKFFDFRMGSGRMVNSFTRDIFLRL
jgi:hypothetical protein